MQAAWAEALERGDAGTLEQLLAGGADPDARDRHGQTSLMRAAHAGQAEVVALLIRHGAALDVTAKFGLSALRGTATSRASSSGRARTALYAEAVHRASRARPHAISRSTMASAGW
jgi:ankyrin repeat protein